MQVLATSGLAAALVAALVVGARLLAVGLRTRRAPELAIGVASLSLALGAIGMLASQRLPDLGGAAAFRLYGAALVAIAAGAVGMAIGVWRMYRAGQRWPLFACALLGVTQAAALWARLASGLPPDPGVVPPSEQFLIGARLAIYAWATWEAFRYHALLRRRLRLGLADPMIAHQLLLWGVAAASLTSVLLVMGVSRVVWGQIGLLSSGVLLLVNPLGLVGALCIWFAFFPPDAYRRFVLSHR